jgi:hypothetical protein
METFNKLLGSLRALVYHGFDRIVIQGYLPLLSRPENFRGLDANVSDRAFGTISAAGPARNITFSLASSCSSERRRVLDQDARRSATIISRMSGARRTILWTRLVLNSRCHRLYWGRAI